jgi:hypothetical protein
MRRSMGWLTLLLAAGLVPAHGTQAPPPFQVIAVNPAPAAVLNSAPAEILVTLNDTIAAGSVGPSTVILVRDGPDNAFGTPDDAVIVPAGISIQGGNQIKIDLTGIPLANDRYRLTLLGNTPISANRVGWWKFDETSGTVASDSSGFGNQGTLGGNPQWQPNGGRIGGALNFDGNGDFVVVPQAASLEPLGSMSVSLWAFITTASGGFADIVRKAGANQGGYLVRWHHFDDRLWWRLDRYGADPPIFVDDPNVTAAYLGAWHHIAGTWNAGTGVSSLYVDGVLINSLGGFSGVLEHTDPLYFMWSPHPGQVALPGRLDDVRIYARALTVPEIQTLASAASDEAVTDLSGIPVDGDGNGAAGGNFVSTFDLDTNLPAAPTLLIAAPGASGGILLNWSDNSTAESEFRIERSSDGTTFAEIGVVGTDVEAFLDGGAAGTFFYRVRAYNGAGGSGFSNPASASSTQAATTSIVIRGCGLLGLEIVLPALLRRRVRRL